MQSALRLAARRAACASSHRGVATTTTSAKARAADTVVEAQREWVTALVQREVRAQMSAAKEEEVLALLRARQAALVDGNADWKRGYKLGFATCFLYGYVAVLSYALYR